MEILLWRRASENVDYYSKMGVVPVFENLKKVHQHPTSTPTVGLQLFSSLSFWHPPYMHIDSPSEVHGRCFCSLTLQLFTFWQYCAQALWVFICQQASKFFPLSLQLSLSLWIIISLAVWLLRSLAKSLQQLCRCFFLSSSVALQFFSCSLIS